MKEKEKRLRRTKKDIEEIILQAVVETIKEDGFHGASLAKIIHKAKIEPVVFYNRYHDINDLFEKFVRSYDYWLNDLFDFDPENFSPEKNCENLLIGLVDSINSNVIMQKLLVWEISELNYITSRSANNRERHSQNMIEYFQKSYADPEINICVVSALIVSGIYYLALHKKVSTFCGIDFNTDEGVELLKDNVRAIVKRIFQSNSNGAEKAIKKNISKKDTLNIDIARKLLKRNVDIEIIKEATGVSDQMIQDFLTD